MSYYDDPKNIEQYIQMAEGYDGKLLIEVLEKYLPNGATVLELGMGSGKDLIMLGEKFTATGSDMSTVFLERFKALHPQADLLHLDAITLDTDRQFDAVYSNKVLYHLTQDQLTEFLTQQLRVLNTDGIALHSFWYGDGDEQMHGLHFTYYTEKALQRLVGKAYEIIEMQRYAEMEKDDSLYMVLKKRA